MYVISNKDALYLGINSLFKRTLLSWFPLDSNLFYPPYVESAFSKQKKSSILVSGETYIGKIWQQNKKKIKN